MDLLARYPLRLGYPGTGQRFLVLWWTHNTGHKLINSEDLAGAQSMLFANVLRQPTLEIRDYRVADLVPPPAEARLAFAEANRKVELSQFGYWLMDLASTYAEHFGKAAPGFKLCRHKSEDARWRCDKCDGTGTIPLISVADLHGRDDLRAEFRKPEPHDVTPLPDPWPGVMPDYVAVLDEGHHRKGIQYLPYAAWLQNSGFGVQILFFFRGEKAELPAVLTDLVAEIHAATKAEKEAEESREEERMREWAKAEVDNAARIFRMIEGGGQ